MIKPLTDQKMILSIITYWSDCMDLPGKKEWCNKAREYLNQRTHKEIISIYGTLQENHV